MKKAYSLIEFILIAGAIILLGASSIVILAGILDEKSINNEVKKINQALFMLSKKPFAMSTDDTFNEKILSKAGFEFLEHGTAYTPAKFKGDFDNLVSIVDFPSAGLKSTYSYSTYEAFKEEYSSDVIANQYKMISDCDNYKQDECEIFFKMNIL